MCESVLWPPEDERERDARQRETSARLAKVLPEKVDSQASAFSRSEAKKCGAFLTATAQSQNKQTSLTWLLEPQALLRRFCQSAVTMSARARFGQ